MEKGISCPHCGANEYERCFSGWRCQYCGTVYSDNDDPDNPAPRIPIPVYVEQRNKQRENAERIIVMNIIPWVVAAICVVLTLVLNPFGIVNDNTAIILLGFIVSVIFGIRGIPKICASVKLLKEIDNSVLTNTDENIK